MMASTLVMIVFSVPPAASILSRGSSSRNAASPRLCRRLPVIAFFAVLRQIQALTFLFCGDP
jgi:hypothetical protein